ncbi:MAG: manganese efflux pump MntP family protein [Paludibacter sp.]|nr:manganese efflux pump MntP family protein [Bacteroidales bacterium]MCM1069057.1 manganese efflux pump MntP family protein [Prevotella sp.]MCM1353496.1 manganese efflux pump MntP family protein [Bacteroides sp.]MCM1442657.1 manganese efflux pump MntP family protein [Muribaculum sp.]MCM1481706.1 manganese efflux pump MntP family protein [Paludibacter sp.]
MDILSIVMIAVGLAMDCFAVSLSTGLNVQKWDYRSLLLALFCGLFQGGMPLIGFYAGIGFARQISRYDHWIALLLLAFIGGKMIVESLRPDPTNANNASQVQRSPFALSRLLMLAVATSIDALATGIIFVSAPEVLWTAIGIIAGVSFLFSVGGYLMGISCGKRFRINMTLIGGLILVAIGIKIFVEHMWIKGC